MDFMIKDCIIKRNIVAIMIFFSDVESSYGKSDSDVIILKNFKKLINK